MGLWLPFFVGTIADKGNQTAVRLQSAFLIQWEDSDASAHVISRQHKLTGRAQRNVTRRSAVGGLRVQQCQLAVLLIKYNGIRRRSLSVILAYGIQSFTIHRRSEIRRIRDSFQTTDISCLPGIFAKPINLDAFFVRCGITAYKQEHFITIFIHCNYILLWLWSASTQQQTTYAQR